METTTEVTGLRKFLLAVTALTSTAMLATACGGLGQDKGKAPVGQSTESRYTQALAYSKCMRAKGDPAWPDPNSNGMFTNNNGSLDRTSAAYKKAAAACKNLEVTGGANETQIEQAFNSLLKYSKCMRQNGVSKFPDPKKEKGGVGIELSGGVDQNSSQYKTALNACKSLQPGGG
jgi:hypothetical protein